MWGTMFFDDSESPLASQTSEDPGMLERYERRIKRVRALDACKEPATSSDPASHLCDQGHLCADCSRRLSRCLQLCVWQSRE